MAEKSFSIVGLASVVNRYFRLGACFLFTSLFMGQVLPVHAASDDVVVARNKTEIQFVGSDEQSRPSRFMAALIKKAFDDLGRVSGKIHQQISWVHDRGLIVDPLLTNKVFDFGIGWQKPDCRVPENTSLCQRFFFSKPLLEVQTARKNDTAGQQGVVFYAIIAKSHPRARTLLYYLNTGIDRLKANGSYHQLLRHYGYARDALSKAN